MMAAIGTFRTWRDVRVESAFGGIAEVGLWGCQGSFSRSGHRVSFARCMGAQDSVLHIRTLRRNHPHGAPALAAIHYSFELICNDDLIRRDAAKLQDERRSA